MGTFDKPSSPSGRNLYSLVLYRLIFIIASLVIGYNLFKENGPFAIGTGTGTDNAPGTALTDQNARNPRITYPQTFRKDSEEPLNTVLIKIFRKKQDQENDSSCTGSILHSKVILTAAHCFVSRKGRSDYSPNHAELKTIANIKIQIGVSKNENTKWVQMIEIPYWEVDDDKSVGYGHGGNNSHDKGYKQYVKMNRNWFKSLNEKKAHNLRHGDLAIILLPEGKSINFAQTGARPVYLFAPGWHNKIPKNHKSRNEWRITNRNTTVIGYGRVSVTQKHRKGLGWSHFKTIEKSECRQHIRDIGWDQDIDLLNIKDVFCAKGIIGSMMIGGKPHKSQICAGDSGGPIFSDILTTEISPTTSHLLQNRIRVQLGISVWVDTNCTQNFNGFLEIEPYLNWIRAVVGKKMFKEIDGRVLPNKNHVANFEKYKDVILGFRKENFMDAAEMVILLNDGSGYGVLDH